MRGGSRVQDHIQLALGLWLIVSPWVLGFAVPLNAAAMSAIVIGLLVLVASVDGLVFSSTVDEWINVALGVALILTPSFLGFEEDHVASANALVCGILITGFGAWAIEQLNAASVHGTAQTPPT